MSGCIPFTSGYSHANSPTFFLRTSRSYACWLSLNSVFICRNFSWPASQGMVWGPVCSSIVKTQDVYINIERAIFSWNSSPKIWSSWAKDWGKSVQVFEETNNWFNTFSVVYSWSAKEKSLGRERSSKYSSLKEQFKHHDFSVIGCAGGV